MGTHPIFESDFDCLTEFLKMPFLKSGMRRKEPLWRERDRAAQKEGLRSTVYYVNGDHYCGEWSDNLRHGLGVMTYKKDKTQYTGDWVRDEKAGEGILSQLINGVYSGQWRNDERNGTGVNFYPEKEAVSEVYYDGNWLDDKRHGQGKMFYGDKSVFDGDWEQDLEMGYGRLYMPNGDMYQGHWKDGKRHGEGEYHFQSRGQIMKGTWSDGICKCAELSAAPDLAAASSPFKYPIPKIELVDPENVLAIARAKYEH